MKALIPRPTTQTTALVVVLCAAAGFGTIPLFSRLAYALDLTPETLLLARYGVPALLLLPLVPAPLFKISGAWTLVAAGAFMGVGAWAYFQALDLLPAPVAALIFFTYPLFVLLWRYAIFREHISRSDLVAGVMVLIAVAIILNPTALADLDIVGVLIAFVGPAGYAALIVAIVRAPSEITPLPVAALLFFGIILTSIPLSFFAAEPVAFPVSMAGWSVLAALMIFVGLLPQISMAAAAPVAGSSLTAIAGSMELVVALVLSSIFLDDTLTIEHGIGAAILVCAIVVTARGRRLNRY
ncbi:MAG: DMT family transporter [Stappiaceae bacterium]